MDIQEKINRRFAEAPWILKDTVITIGGLGGIGSNLAYLLAKIGLSLRIYDFDIVEEHNIGGQMFDLKDIGEYKSDAIINRLVNINPSIDVIDCDRFDEGSVAEYITFSCFDNMKARKDMFNSWKTELSRISSEKVKTAIFIDARLVS